MARVTFVKRAQARYKTVPVLDENGQQKRVPVNRRDGTQKVSKRGPVFMSLTREDRDQPLPNRHCDKCGTEIEPGQPYKWIKPKSGPYGGRLMVRCGTCPVWQVWEYNHSLSSQLARIAYEAEESFDAEAPETADAVTDILSTAAEEIRNLAEEKRDSASNIEEGFGHPTSSSEELEEIADSLESWADEVEQADVPEAPDEDEYTDHEFDPDQDGENCLVEDCERSEDEHDVTYEEALENWREDARQALEVLDESPV